MPVFTLKQGLELWLASASPRRKALLTGIGLAPQILVSPFPEPEPRSGEPPAAYARRAAKAKSVWAYANLAEMPAVIIAADTVVSATGKILGKPAGFKDAFSMLANLNNGWHEVVTAVHMHFPDSRPTHFCERTKVHFADWPEPVLRAYAHSGEPLDKAGAYGIQDMGGFLADAVRGSWTNVVGLPLARVIKILLERDMIEAREIQDPY